MSSNFNFKKDKCWSCEHFCGGRQLKRGIISGDSVRTDSYGFCGCKRGPKSGKRVGENEWCSKYHKWSALQSIILQEQQKKEQAIAERRMREQRERERRELEAEQRRLRQEREELERQQYLASLSPEERQRIEEEEEQRKRDALRRAQAALAISRAHTQREQQERKILEKERTLQRTKRQPIIVTLIASAAGAIAFFLSWIPHLVALYDVSTTKMIVASWYKQGHPETDTRGEQYRAALIAAEAKANATIWIPIVVLVITLAVIALVIILVRKSKKRKASIIALENEIKAMRSNLVVIPSLDQIEQSEDIPAIVSVTSGENSPQPLASEEIVREAVRASLHVTVSSLPTPEGAFMGEYNEEYAFLTFLHKYPMIKAADLLSEEDYPHWMWFSCGVKEVAELHRKVEEAGFSYT